MADQVVDPNAVRMNANSSPTNPIAGVVFSAGETVYKSSGTYLKASASASDTAAVSGIAATSVVAIGDKFTLISGGEYDPGFTVVPTQTYVQSVNDGKICLESDLATGDWYTLIGVGMTVDLIKLQISPLQFQVP